MKKILIALFALFASILFIATPSYASYDIPIANQYTYSFTYQRNTRMGTSNTYVYEYMIDLVLPVEPSMIPVYIYMYFDNPTLQGVFSNYWNVSTNGNDVIPSSLNGVYECIGSYYDGTNYYIDHNFKSIQFASSFSSIFYLYLSVNNPSGVNQDANIQSSFFSNLSFTDTTIKLTDFITVNYDRVMTYNNGYNDGYNSAITNNQQQIDDSYDQGYADGVSNTNNDNLTLVNFIPKILGQAFGFFFVIFSYEIPIIGITGLQIMLSLLGITLIFVTIRLVRG